VTTGRVFLALAALAALAAWPGSSRAADTAPPIDDGAFVQGEKSVEARLLAPCCWNGTLDVHESDLASALRKEIRSRLRGGEDIEAVEEALVSRYGERMRAAPKSERVGLLLGAGVLAVFVAAAALLRKAVARSPGREGARNEASDEWDRRLDEELERRRA
jgi:cytochrome c-type biogenesis protein CcmH